MKSDEKFGSVRSFGFRAPRVRANFNFLLEVTQTGDRCEAVCTDISEDGLAAEVTKPLAPKTPVTMSMLLPGDATPLHIQGTVEYSQDLHCGLTFVYSSTEEKKQVQEFIRSIS